MVNSAPLYRDWWSRLPGVPTVWKTSLTFRSAEPPTIADSLLGTKHLRDDATWETIASHDDPDFTVPMRQSPISRCTRAPGACRLARRAISRRFLGPVIHVDRSNPQMHHCFTARACGDSRDSSQRCFQDKPRGLNRQSFEAVIRAGSCQPTAFVFGVYGVSRHFRRVWSFFVSSSAAAGHKGW